MDTEALMKILAELRPDVDFEENKELVDSGELDSFDIVSLVVNFVTLTISRLVRTILFPKTLTPLRPSAH